MSRYRMDGLSDGFIKGLQIGEAIKSSRVKEQLAGFKAKYAQYADEQQKDIDADDIATRLMEQYDIPSDSAAYHNIYDAARLGKSISSIETMIRNNKSSWAALEAKADNLTSPIDGTSTTPNLDIADQTNAALTEAANEVEEGEPLPEVQTSVQPTRLIQASNGFEGKLISAESGGDNSAMVTDTQGRTHAGELMFGEMRLADYNQATGNNLTVNDLKNLNEDQRKALRDWHLKDLTDWANNAGLQEFVGTEINGIKVTSDGILAMAHLGGKTGAENFLRSNGENNPSDQVQNPDGTMASTSLSDYLKKFGDPQGNIITQTDNALGVETPNEEEGNQEQVPPTETGGLISWFKKKHREKMTDEILIQTGLTNIDTFNAIMSDPTGRGAYTPIRRGSGEPLPLRLVSSDGSTKGNFVENMRLDDSTQYPELGDRTLAEIFTNETDARTLARADAIIEKLWKDETNIDRTTQTADAMLWDTFQRSDEAYREAMKVAEGYDPNDEASHDQKYFDALKTITERTLFFKSMDDPAKTALAAKTSYMQTVYDSPAWEATEQAISDYKAIATPTDEDTANYNKALATQRELLTSAELVWKTTTDISEGSNTYTQGNYTADKIKQEQILAKPEEDRSEEEKNWLTNFNLIEKAYLAASDATTTAPDPDEIVVTYVDSNGITKSKNVYVNPEGGYIDPATGEPWNAQTTSEDGQANTPFTVVNTMTLAEADDSQQAVSQASSTISPLTEKWIAVSQLTTNARSLSDKVAEYEMILTSAGALNSFWGSFNTEIQGFMSWMGQNGRNYDSSTIMAAVEEYNAGGGLQSFDNKKAADVYKQFQADMVRFIFSVGRAEGQAGNGFSNQDYRVLSRSVNAGNNFNIFTKTLKDMVRGQWESYNDLVTTASNTPVVMNARRTTDVFDTLLTNNQARFTQEKVDAGLLPQASLDNYSWAQSPTGQVVGVRTDSTDELTSKLGQNMFPPELETDIREKITNGEKFYILLLPNGNYYLQEFAR